MSLRYRTPSEISKEAFLHSVEAGEVAPICQAIVDAVHSIDDYDWLYKQLSELLRHSDGQVRGVTATCIGHLARLHRSADRDHLLTLLKPHLSDPEIAGQVEDAIGDVKTFAL